MLTNQIHKRFRLLEERIEKIERLIGSKNPSPDLISAIEKFLRGYSAPLNEIYGNASIEQSQVKSVKKV